MLHLMDIHLQGMQGFLYIQAPAWKPFPYGSPFSEGFPLLLQVRLQAFRLRGHQSADTKALLAHSIQNTPDCTGCSSLFAPDYGWR